MKKRRFAEGGFSDIDEGRDTPDQALARKASMSPMAASDKAAGLKASKGEDVGFFKRLSMGNIDKADSEAGQQFGAGRARLDRMPAAPDRSKSEGLETSVRPTPRPPITIPSTPIDMAESPMLRAGTPTGPGTYKRDTEGEAASTLARESVRKTPTNAPVKPTVKPRPMKNPTAGEAREGPAAQLAADKMGDTNPRDAEKGMSRGRPAITGEIANLDSRAVRDRKTAQMMMAQDEKLRKKRAAERLGMDTYGMKKGGAAKAYASGGSVSSRADGCAQRGKTRGMMR